MQAETVVIDPIRSNHIGNETPLTPFAVVAPDVLHQNGTAIIMAFSFDPQSTSNYYYTINSFVNCLAKEREHQSRINDEYNIN